MKLPNFDKVYVHYCSVEESLILVGQLCDKCFAICGTDSIEMLTEEE